jgi:outer membrane protein assembly factor BamE (lipoprotein component of BamABCDE complex)
MRFIKHYLKFIIIISFFILTNCQLQDPIKSHGIVYLENRSKKLQINDSNKNDVIRIFGQPQIKDEIDQNTWIYIERILSKGKFHKLGRHVLEENNVLVLQFNKYGVLNNLEFFNKENMNDVSFSKMETTNELSKESFVESFLQSIKQKMYRRRN